MGNVKLVLQKMKGAIRTISLLGIFMFNFQASSIKNAPVSKLNSSCGKEIAVLKSDNNDLYTFLKVNCVQLEGWDTMAEVKFWRRIITLSKDSSMANVFETRRLLKTFPRRFIDSVEKAGNLDSLRLQMCREYGLSEDTRIKFTGGKKWFYEFSGVKSKMARAIQLFDSLGTDPFYAQSVLLIESPGTNKAKSTSGAYGYFQLMPFVAKQYGLRVDKYKDERESFDRSAYAAARLFSEICVPYARKWCEMYGFVPDEKALWFKLLALHCYNAGSTTVKYAMQTVSNENQGNQLIYELWHTNYGRFQSEAQNYSQIAIACYLEYEKVLSVNQTVSAVPYVRF